MVERPGVKAQVGKAVCLPDLRASEVGGGGGAVEVGRSGEEGEVDRAIGRTRGPARTVQELEVRVARRGLEPKVDKAGGAGEEGSEGDEADSEGSGREAVAAGRRTRWRQQDPDRIPTRPLHRNPL